MLELFLLLLPVAAFSGWLIGRRDANQQQKMQDVGADYLQGLSFLLNDQQDEALDIFIRMLESNSDVVEIHMALGNLFRKQGEVERSIRIHQNLIARPTLNSEFRSQALFELAQDYMKAGLLDRAEKLFLEILDKKKFTLLALKQLLDIYQQEKDWPKAIQIAERLQYLSDSRYKNIQSHFYCEMVELAIQNNDYKSADKLLQKAVFTDKKNPRANILEGDLFLHAGNYKKALKSYHKIASDDAGIICEVIDNIIKCYIALNLEKDMLDFFSDLYKTNPFLIVSPKFGELVFSTEGKELREILFNRLSEIKTTDELLGVIMLTDQHPEFIRQSMEKLLTSTRNIHSMQTRYTCVNCGFRAKLLHWNCPGCHQWGCIKPSLGAVDASLTH